MDLALKIKNRFPEVERIKLLNCGLVLEIRKPKDSNSEWLENIYRRIADFAWQADQEIIYSFYSFSNTQERFTVDGTLRTTRTIQSYTISSSLLTSVDVFGKFTRFDFDILTLANRDEDTEVLFTIDQSSPSRNPITEFKELDLQGHQFPIKAKAMAKLDYFSIKAEPGLDL